MRRKGKNMEFEEVVSKRRSVRSFKDEDIPEEEIREIIRIGHEAPSAGNLQARDFIIVRDEEEKKKLASNAYDQRFVYRAPWDIVVCADEERSAKKYGERGKELYSIQDASATVQNILLAVVDKGYGAVWIGAFDEKKVADQLNTPSGVRPVAIIPIGVPGESPSEPPKMNAKELTHLDNW